VSTIQAILNAESVSWVDTQAVTVNIQPTSGGQGPGTNVSIATTSQLDEYQTRRAFGDFSHDVDTKAWTIPDALLNPADNGNVLKNGDSITDSTPQLWLIVQVKRVKMNTQWICLTTRGT
jgi:hypothetical protein